MFALPTSMRTLFNCYFTAIYQVTGHRYIIQSKIFCYTTEIDLQAFRYVEVLYAYSIYIYVL